MTPDPNSDLVGYRFETELGPARVIRTTEWSPGYVLVYIEGHSNGLVTARQAKQVRRRKELESS